MHLEEREDKVVQPKSCLRAGWCAAACCILFPKCLFEFGLKPWAWNDGIFFNGLSNNAGKDQWILRPWPQRYSGLQGQTFRPCMGLMYVRDFYGFKPQRAICSKSCSPASGNGNISAFLWQLLLSEPCPHKFTEYLCAGVWETGKPARSCLFMVYWKTELYYLLWSPQAWTKTMTSVLREMFLSYLHRSLIQSCFSFLLL